MRAFTLIEILISIVILCVIIFAILSVLYVADLNWHTEVGLLDLQQQARQSMDGMIREIRQGKLLTISSGGGRIDFSIPVSILNPDSYYNVSYYLENDQIIREHPIGTRKNLANNITNLSFCCWYGASCGTDCTGSEVLQIQLKAQKTSRDIELAFPQEEGKFLTEKVKLRN